MGTHSVVEGGRSDVNPSVEAAGGSPGYGADELSACLKVLHALRSRPIASLEGEAHLAEVVAAAAGLIRDVNAHRRAEGRERDAELLEGAGIRAKRAARDGGPDPTGPARDRPAFELDARKKCYVCKGPTSRPHDFYDALCKACGDRNHAKRSQSADMGGMVALVTGARVKIGYQVALKLLRAGAAVVGTSRFPVDAAARFAREPDFDAWGRRLALHAIDLRHLGEVRDFAATLAGRSPRLDVLINNAAQTIRRPSAFYRHLLEAERLGPSALPPAARALIAEPSGRDSPAPSALPIAEGGRWGGLPLAAALSQVPLGPEDLDDDPEHFPPGLLDADGQQVDRRGRNSWSLTLGEVSPWELVEVHAVNCLAPFLLIRGLDGLLRADAGRGKYIINVSAVEGQFRGRPEVGRHPHTNMAKAGLDMITRTCAGEFAEAGIYMNSVDTGWITDMFPHPEVQLRVDSGFQPPLDEVDGAARVCDPIFEGLNTGRNRSGKFFKDYREVPW